MYYRISMEELLLNIERAKQDSRDAIQELKRLLEAATEREMAMEERLEVGLNMVLNMGLNMGLNPKPCSGLSIVHSH